MSHLRVEKKVNILINQGGTMELIINGYEIRLSRDTLRLANSIWKESTLERFEQFAHELHMPTAEQVRLHLHDKIIEAAKERTQKWV